MKNNISDIRVLPDIVNDLKSMGALKMKLVAPMPEQIVTTKMQFLHIQGNFFLMMSLLIHPSEVHCWDTISFHGN